MRINRKNAEGYSDPTTYEALMNIAEIARAKARKIVIRYFNDCCEEVEAWACQRN